MADRRTVGKVIIVVVAAVILIAVGFSVFLDNENANENDGVHITSHTMTTKMDYSGNEFIEVSGTIKNKNDLAVRDVVVLVRFVDENGDKLATKTATIDEIPAGETADFSVGYWELERHYGAIKDYTLKVTWENKIPENQP